MLELRHRLARIRNPAALGEQAGDFGEVECHGPGSFAHRNDTRMTNPMRRHAAARHGRRGVRLDLPGRGHSIRRMRSTVLVLLLCIGLVAAGCNDKPKPGVPVPKASADVVMPVPFAG
ncbi:hypothetical protein GmRootV116_10980 [Variovorax sp. V116]